VAWVHPALSSERLEMLRFWALRSAEQSREFGEPEAEWSSYLDTADRAADLLDQRAHCHHTSRYAGCAALRMRASEENRKARDSCFFPLCLISARRNRPGHIRFHFDK
jgi:hypothetical protein